MVRLPSMAERFLAQYDRLEAGFVESANGPQTKHSWRGRSRALGVSPKDLLGIDEMGAHLAAAP